jgi:hypothetical protein
MDSWFHPSVEEIKQAVQSKGGTLTCTVCGREEYAVEEVDIMSGHRAYGAHQLHRAQLVCASVNKPGFDFDYRRTGRPPHGYTLDSNVRHGDFDDRWLSRSRSSTA